MLKNSDNWPKYISLRSWTFTNNICFSAPISDEKSIGETNADYATIWSVTVNVTVI